MMINELLKAVTLFGLGMGTVFVLLSILISCVTLLSWLCKKIEPQQSVSLAQNTNTTSSSATAEIDAVKLAVKSHRNAMGL